MYVLIKLFFAGMATREDSCLLPIPTLGSVNEATGGARYMYINNTFTCTCIHVHLHMYMYMYICVWPYLPTCAFSRGGRWIDPDEPGPLRATLITTTTAMYTACQLLLT